MRRKRVDELAGAVRWRAGLQRNGCTRSGVDLIPIVIRAAGERGGEVKQVLMEDVPEVSRGVVVFHGDGVDNHVSRPIGVIEGNDLGGSARGENRRAAGRNCARRVAVVGIVAAIECRVGDGSTGTIDQPAGRRKYVDVCTGRGDEADAGRIGQQVVRVRHRYVAGCVIHHPDPARRHVRFNLHHIGLHGGVGRSALVARQDDHVILRQICRCQRRGRNDGDGVTQLACNNNICVAAPR